MLPCVRRSNSNTRPGSIRITPRKLINADGRPLTNLAGALADKTMPIGEVDDACHEMFRIVETNKKQYEDCYYLIEGKPTKNWRDESIAWFINGEGCIRKAWFARGTGSADQVKPDDWNIFFATLRKLGLQ